MRSKGFSRPPSRLPLHTQQVLYAINRETGEPIWPIEERPVPASNVPGEILSQTQPFPTRPAPYDLQGRTEDHLIDYTPEIKEMARQVAVENNLFNGLFDPPTTIDDPAARARLELPGRRRRHQHHGTGGWRPGQWDHLH